MEEDLEILLEDIRGKFDLVLEGHELLRREIRGTRGIECQARADGISAPPAAAGQEIGKEEQGRGTPR